MDYIIYVGFAICVIVMIVGFTMLNNKIKQLSNTIDVLTHNTNGDDIIEVIESHYDKIDGVVNNQEKIFKILTYLTECANASLRRVNLIRYNPHSDIGGDFSFVLCILDADDNGVIINSVYHHQGGQIYCKQVVKGKPLNQLADIEVECLEETLEKF